MKRKRLGVVTDGAFNAGLTVRLDAAGTHDPDGDALSYRWWQYKEAGTADAPIEIRKRTSPEASFKMPKVKAGQTIHVILEVTDDGEPKLAGYRRIVVTGRGE